MYIKLIQPKMEARPMDSRMKSRMAPSLGLYTIAALFEGIHKVCVENENIEPIRYDDAPDIVGITVTVDVLPRAVEIAARFRKQGIPVVAGGIHITTAPDAVPPGCFDVLCVGMAEGTWERIMHDLERGELAERYTCPKNVTGQDIRSPAYHLIEPSKYLFCNVVHTSRGCPFQCDFCYNSSIHKQYLRRPVGDVVRDIQSVGSKHILFVDDNFLGNPAWTREMLTALKQLRVKWNAAVSANIVDMPDLLDQMRDSGCQGLFIGFESINSDSLEGVGKVQNSVTEYDRLVEAIHSRGIMINASFVFGLDSDTPETFRATSDWIVSRRIETVTSHILTPYPGTRLYDRMVGDGRILTFDFSLYNTAHVVFTPARMSEKELYDGYLWIYRSVYSWKNILKRIPKSKKSIGAYLMFNIFYRKYGRMTDCLCRLLSYRLIGFLGAKMSKYMK